MSMKVSWFHQFGEPQVLVYEETAVPTPAAGEALVRVRAVGVNHVDLDVRAGTARMPVKFPHILGREFAGEVAALGEPGSAHKEGDRVWVECRLSCGNCEFCLTGRDNLCERRGGFFGMDLPGPGCIYISQELRFRAPVRVGDTVQARVVVEEIQTERRRARLQCSCLVAGKVVLDGIAVVMVDSRQGIPQAAE